MLKNHAELVPLLLINAILLIYFMVAFMLFRRWKTKKYLILVSTTGGSFLVYAIFLLVRMFQNSALGDLRFMLALLNPLEVCAMIVLVGSFYFLSPKNKKNFAQLLIVAGSLLLLSMISIFMKGPVLSILILLLSGVAFYIFFWFRILPLLTKKKYFFIAIGAQFMAMIFQMIYVLSHNSITIFGSFLFQAILFTSMLLAFFDRILDLVQIALQQSVTQASSSLGQTKADEEPFESNDFEPDMLVTEIQDQVELASQDSSSPGVTKSDEETNANNHSELNTLETEVSDKVKLVSQDLSSPDPAKTNAETMENNHSETEALVTEIPDVIEVAGDRLPRSEVSTQNLTLNKEEVKDLNKDTVANTTLKVSVPVIDKTKHPFLPKEATNLPRFGPVVSDPIKSEEDLPINVEMAQASSRQVYSEKTRLDRKPKLSDEEERELEAILEANYRSHYGDRNPEDSQKYSAIQANKDKGSEGKEVHDTSIPEKEIAREVGGFINPFKKD